MISIDEADEKIKEYGYVNFEPTKNEKWSVYCLADGTILKLKLIPLKFIKKDDDYAVSATAVMVSFSQSELKGEPSTTPLPITEAEKKGVLDKDKTNMTFDSIEEPWNEYKFTLDGTKVSIRTFATEISGTNKKDAYGDPIYLVTHQSIIQKHPAL
jgi:hypothetical protein